MSPQLEIVAPDQAFSELILTNSVVQILDKGADPELLGAKTTGTNIQTTFDAATGTLVLSGTDSAENYQSVLRTLSYENTSHNPDTTPRRLTVDIGGGSNSSSTATVEVVGVNDAPNLMSIEDQEIRAGDLLEVVLSATDIDSDSVTFFLDRDDTNLNFLDTAMIVATSGLSAVLRWQTGIEDVGEYLIRLIATDNAARPRADFEQFSLSVLEAIDVAFVELDEDLLTPSVE